MLHSISFAVFFDCDMYLEVEEGELHQTWKDDKKIDFWTFRYLLSNQMIEYNPTHHKYAGDANMRPDTQQNQAAREKSKETTRVKRGRPSAEKVQLSKFAKKL